ncbi:DUF6928 family protein [Micromonospora matsumotoense]|uniref:DUF6928 family protein n=1 Tax=Micromonospora matsumotoense TaxID=121616 RepID=UPI003F4E435D
MGANTALPAFTTGELRPALRARIQSDSAGVRDLVRELHPGYQVTLIGGGSLGDHGYPPVDTTYASTRGDADPPTRPRAGLRPRPGAMPRSCPAVGSRLR